MPDIKPVFVPPPGSTPTPGQNIGKQVNSDQYWREKAAEARARREYVEENKNIENLEHPQAAAEPPVKMTGSINLGNIDFQEQAREAKAAEAAARQRAEEETTRLRAENEKLKTDLIANTINNLQTSLGNQIQKLQADLAGGRGNSKSIGDQLKEIIDSAALLGYVRPDTNPKPAVVQNATDAAVSLEMLRLQLEDKRTERSFAWQMEKDRRQFQVDLKKLDQANRLAAAEISAKKERDAFVFQMPEIIGNTIAKGLISSRGGSTPPIQARPNRPRQAENIETAAPISEPARKVEAGINEAGTIDCPECGQPIAIGPTATRAVCASCDYSVDVVRKGG